MAQQQQQQQRGANGSLPFDFRVGIDIADLGDPLIHDLVALDAVFPPHICARTEEGGWARIRHESCGRKGDGGWWVQRREWGGTLVYLAALPPVGSDMPPSRQALSGRRDLTLLFYMAISHL